MYAREFHWQTSAGQCRELVAEDIVFHFKPDGRSGQRYIRSNAYFKTDLWL